MTDNLILGLLKRNGPSLSSDLARELEATGLSPEAARKRISRGVAGVNRLAGLVFPKGVRFFYLESDYNGERYWRALAEAAGKASPAYGAALAALEARGGIIPIDQFSIICGSPVRQAGQISSENVLKRLEAVKLVRRADLDGLGTCIMLGGNGFIGGVDVDGLRARLITENILLLAVRDWARKLGMASYDRIEVRGIDAALPRYGTFNWDLCGPSYLAPMVRYDKTGKPKPGFLVCDTVSGETIDERAIAAFIRKCKLSASLRNLPPVMPILIADRFTREAFRLGKSYGIVMATPYSLFGREVAIGLATLLTTLGKAAAIAVSKPEVITELFDRLGQIEGAAGNLRGALFEMIVAHAVQRESGGSIDIGLRVKSNLGFRAEIDVLRAKAAEVRCYECKGYQPDHLVGLDEVKRWVEEKVPGTYQVLRAQERFAAPTAVHFEFWTSGGFTAEAIAFLNAAKAKTKRYGIHYRGGADVRKFVAAVNAPGLVKTLDEHYFNHPLTRTNAKYDAPAALDAVELSLELELGGGVDDDDDEGVPYLALTSPSPALATPTTIVIGRR